MPTNALVNRWLRLNLNRCGRRQSVERRSAAHRAGLQVSWPMLPKRDSRRSAGVIPFPQLYPCESCDSRGSCRLVRGGPRNKSALLAADLFLHAGDARCAFGRCERAVPPQANSARQEDRCGDGAPASSAKLRSRKCSRKRSRKTGMGACRGGAAQGGTVRQGACSGDNDPSAVG